MEELGPTFIKFGQILSTRPDLLPPAFISEFEKLQDRVAPFDSKQAKKIVEQELGKPLDQMFKHFENKPVAAASLSQVHKATLHDGTIVAVKIQRPEIRKNIELDLAISENLAGLLKHSPYNGWNIQPKLLVKEFKRAIEKEIDFVNEAHNYEKFRVNFKDIEYMKVPKVYWAMTTSKVLVMEFIDGVKINEITNAKYNGLFDPEKVAKEGAESVLKQILEDGFFHADPHPANLLVLAPATIVMLDVGMTGYLDEKTITGVLKFLQAIIDKNLKQVLLSMGDLGILVEKFDHTLLCQDLEYMLDRYLGVPLKNLRMSEIFQQILEIMVRHNLTLPPNLVLMIKALSTIETTGCALYPEFDLVSAARPFLKRLLRKKFSPNEILKRGVLTLKESMELVEQLPRELIDIFNKLQEGKLKMNFEHKGMEPLTREINHASDRISVSLIIAALIIGSSLVLQQQGIPLIYGYPILGVLGYVLASLIGFILLISIIKSWK